jgi:hypothetical protein
MIKHLYVCIIYQIKVKYSGKYTNKQKTNRK